MAQLIRKENWFNPMFLGGKEINHLVFFDCKTGKTILEPENENIRWFGSNNNYPEINLPFEFKKANKVDLFRNDAFFTPYAYKYSSDKGKIVIYIPVQLLDNFKELGEKMDFETDTAKQYLRHYSFDVMAKKQEHKLNDFGKLEYYTGELAKHTLSFHGYYRNELKPFGERVQSITERLKAANIDISKYDVEKMLSVCEITLK